MNNINHCYVDNIHKWVGAVPWYNYTLEYGTPTEMFWWLKCMLKERHEIFDNNGAHVFVSNMS